MSRTGRLLRLTGSGVMTAPACRKRARAKAAGVTAMNYILMMNAPRGTGDWSVMDWPADDLKAHIRFTKELSENGELVAAEGLAAPEQARLVRAGKGGAPEVTDGPFAESGVPGRLLDRRRRESAASVRDCRPCVSGGPDVAVLR